MRTLPALLFLLLILPSGVSACFGPKLYIGTEADPRSDVLYALVSLYVKEKTGTETVRVPLQGKDPLREIREERVDMALLLSGDFDPVLLRVSGWPPLASGRRPLEELQFTTVPAALRKLNALLTPAHLDAVLRQVRGGASAAATARGFLTRQGWI